MKIFTHVIVMATLSCFLTLSNKVSANTDLAADPVKLFSPEKEAKLIELLKKAGKAERDPTLFYLLFDQLEFSSQQQNPLSWDSTAWIGRDSHKIYFKTEGESVSGETDSENQLLYSHAIFPFWDVQAGATFDQSTEGKDQNWATVGVQGLAPYFFDTSIYLLLNNNNAGVSFDGEFDFLFSQRLILTPQIKVNYYSQDQPEYGIGSGLSSSELGVRLRYEINRKLAPYFGVKWQKSYGATADLLKQANTKSSDVSVVAGVRFWF
ncbi:MAG: copper resistance protein CopB [Gammaproteobacteria bacterium]|nr:MAG: copper resistance protein CopB [Gammaproteobacteria bacterium]